MIYENCCPPMKLFMIGWNEFFWSALGVCVDGLDYIFIGVSAWDLQIFDGYWPTKMLFESNLSWL